MDVATDREVRLELLIGHLADLLTPSRELVNELQLRSNASHVTRGELAFLRQLTGSLWERLGAIREEASQLRASEQQ